MAAFAGPMVRIRLPPVASQSELCVGRAVAQEVGKEWRQSGQRCQQRAEPPLTLPGTEG
jgi:hypothetical protein